MFAKIADFADKLDTRAQEKVWNTPIAISAEVLDRTSSKVVIRNPSAHVSKGINSSMKAEVQYYDGNDGDYYGTGDYNVTGNYEDTR